MEELHKVCNLVYLDNSRNHMLPIQKKRNIGGFLLYDGPWYFHYGSIQLCDILWNYFLGFNSSGTFWEKNILPLFLLDGTFYGAWN